MLPVPFSKGHVQDRRTLDPLRTVAINLSFHAPIFELMVTVLLFFKRDLLLALSPLQNGAHPTGQSL